MNKEPISKTQSVPIKYQPKKQASEKKESLDNDNTFQEKPQTARQQYRKKGEPKDENAPSNGHDLNQNGQDLRKRRNSESQNKRPESKQYRQRNNEQNKSSAKDAKYRPKGTVEEQNEEEEQKNEGRQKREKNTLQADKQNTQYVSPMEFKETKKFKNKWEEYRFGDWRRDGMSKTYVTLETVIPPLPENPLPPPDEDVFHKKLADIEAKIKLISKSLEDKKTQFEDVLQQKISQQKSGETGQVHSKEIGQKIKRVSELIAQKKKIFQAQEEILKDQPELIYQKSQLDKKVDPEYNDINTIEKDIKKVERKLNTQSLNQKQEADIIRRIQFMKDSVPFIEKRTLIEKQIKEQNQQKREIGKDLGPIIEEIKKLQSEIEILKKDKNVQQTSREEFDKQIEKINEKRNKDRDEKDKLWKQRDELKDAYYGALIDYSKQQVMIKDIKWMTDIQQQIIARKEEKERREREYQEKQERIKQEKEERRLKEEERKLKEQQKKEQEAEKKRLQEEQQEQNEINQLDQIILSIEQNQVGQSPFFEQIEQCEFLIKLCKKQTQKQQSNPAEEEEKKEVEKKNAQNELQKALQKGSVVMAPSKEEKNKDYSFSSLKTQKKKTNKKVNSDQKDQVINVDYTMIKKFSQLKISPPLVEEEHESKIKELQQLKDALLYWGSIILRQNKIKFIRNSQKIKLIDKYIKIADDELEFIQQEKQKFSEENAGEISGIDSKMLKIAQVLDKEIRLKKVMEEEDEEVEDNQQEERDKKREEAYHGGKQKQAQKVNKFKEIREGSEAFPSLENQDDDEEDEQTETQDQ